MNGNNQKISTSHSEFHRSLDSLDSGMDLPQTPETPSYNPFLVFRPFQSVLILLGIIPVKYTTHLQCSYR